MAWAAAAPAVWRTGAPRPPSHPMPDSVLRSSAAAMLLVASIGVAATTANGQAQAGRRPLPARMLWAWERPTDLSSLPADAGVAYLAGTVRLSGDVVAATPRLQPLVVAPAAVVVAVVRIESAGRQPAAPSAALAERTAREVAALVDRAPRVSGVQIDFDAGVTDRALYADVLARLRRRLPPAWSLSITALASWCLGDPWIRNLPIDDAVPMLFRMGVGAAGVRERLAAGADFALGACRSSVGVSLDEPLTVPVGRRVYVFSPSGWNARTIAEATARGGWLR
jgi:hypothetical protein